ncbi:hypothetical protein CoNPh17_CDS0152 [Staphylococcus phage S-CoN_Ph17]|nr:hypothetical protein CoNPh17_CDS0152 [Staphylococcus phage S-CoN_Ph17]
MVKFNVYEHFEKYIERSKLLMIKNKIYYWYIIKRVTYLCQHLLI